MIHIFCGQDEGKLADFYKDLEKLAAQGLFLKKYRPLVCTFTRGESRRVRYRPAD